MIVKPLLDVLSGNRRTTPPLWLMRQAGRYLPEYRKVRQKAGSFLDLCYSPKLAAEVTLQPIRRFGFDAAIIFSDILVVPHAMGYSLAYKEKEGPSMEAVASARDIRETSAKGRGEKLAPVYEAIERVREKLPEETALIGFAGAPWTVATYMVEGGGSKHFDKVRVMAAREPELFGRIIDQLVEATASHLIAQVRAGADALQLFDSWAGVLDEEGFRRWVMEPTRAIFARVRKACPAVPLIGFPRGAGVKYEAYAKALPVQAVSIDYALPPAWAAKNIQPHAVVQGNLDPAVLFTDRKTITAAVNHLKKTLGRKPYIFNLGHGILPKTPIEHVEWLVKAVRGRSKG